jgi:hypothetical protein
MIAGFFIFVPKKHYICSLLCLKGMVVNATLLTLIRKNMW